MTDESPKNQAKSADRHVCSSGVHNRLAGDIVRQIVKGPLDAGGDVTDVLVLLESVVSGVLLTFAKLGRDEIVLETLTKGVSERLAKIRLGRFEADVKQ